MGLHKPPQMTQVYEDALELQAFAAAHPGLYAMGDRAGFTEFFMGQPLIQTEGLMMDFPFLGKIHGRSHC